MGVVYRGSRYWNPGLENGEFRVCRSCCHVLISLQAPLDLSRVLLHSYSDRGDGVLVDHLPDFFTFFDHHEMQIYDTGETRRGVNHGSSGAIRINGIGSAPGCPFLRWWHAVDNDMVYLGQITVAVKMGHGYAADRDASSDDESFYRGSVITVKRSVRARMA